MTARERVRAIGALVIIGAVARPSPAQPAAGTVTGVVEVVRAKDVPAGRVLVYLVGFAEPPPAEPVVVRQRDRQFRPDLIALTTGQRVTFPNGDPLLHNVFSPTSERTFDLGSYKQGDSRQRVFPGLGVIEIYCNIHPEMSATAVVLPNRRFAFADAAGRFELRGVPPGTWRLFAYSRRAVRPATATVTVTAGGTVTAAALRLEEYARDFTHLNKFGEKYKPKAIYNPE